MSILVRAHRKGYALIINGETSCFFTSFREAMGYAQSLLRDED